jgi:hypothetical protein
MQGNDMTLAHPKFRLHVTFALAILSTTPSYTSAQSVVSPPEKSLGNLKYGDLPISVPTNVSTETFVVSYADFEPTKFHMGLVKPKVPSEGGASLARLMEDANAIAIMNGGFLDSTVPATPAGFLKIEKQIINRPSDVTKDKVVDGLVCFSGLAGNLSTQTLVITSYANFGIATDYPDCVQAGPLLALDGQELSNLKPLDDDPSLKSFSSVAASRSFLARTRSGNIVMGVTTPVSLYSLKAALLKPRTAGGFEVKQAIALTGRSSAGLMVGTAFRRGNPNTLLPDAIAIVRE